MRRSLVITDPAAFQVKLAAIPVSERLARNGRDLAGIIDASDTPQLFPQDLAFLRYLKLISGVLILATAATPEVRALRRDAFRRGRDDPG